MCPASMAGHKTNRFAAGLHQAFAGAVIAVVSVGHTLGPAMPLSAKPVTGEMPSTGLAICVRPLWQPTKQTAPQRACARAPLASLLNVMGVGKALWACYAVLDKITLA